MNEKKNTGFAALILSLIVVVVAVLAVKFAGGTAASAVKPAPGPEVTPGGDETPAGKYGVGTYTSTSKGFGGDVTVFTLILPDAPNHTMTGNIRTMHIIS